MWVVEWEEPTSNRGYRHQAEALTERAAEAHAKRLIHSGIHRAVFYEIDDLPRETP